MKMTNVNLLQIYSYTIIIVILEISIPNDVLLNVYIFNVELNKINIFNITYLL